MIQRRRSVKKEYAGPPSMDIQERLESMSWGDIKSLAKSRGISVYRKNRAHIQYELSQHEIQV